MRTDHLVNIKDYLENNKSNLISDSSSQNDDTEQNTIDIFKKIDNLIQKKEIVELIDEKEELEKEKEKIYEQNKKFEKENNELKNKIIEKENIIKDLNNQIEYLNNKVIILEDIIKDKKTNNNISMNNSDKLIELMDKLEQNNDELNELKSKIGFDLKKEEKLMTIIFISFDEQIYYSVICKNTDKFNRIEELLYEKYPEFKISENYFFHQEKKINRFNTIEENGIKYSDLIILNQ